MEKWVQEPVKKSGYYFVYDYEDGDMSIAKLNPGDILHYKTEFRSARPIPVPDIPERDHLFPM